ncbi:MAG: chlorophyll a/b-binding protein [Cyanobacteria bacterium P01_D01_bin.44]
MANLERRSVWGFTRSTESLHGRMAMLGILLAVLIELLSGQGVLAFLQLI